MVDVNNLQVELRSMNILLTTPLTKRLERLLEILDIFVILFAIQYPSFCKKDLLPDYKNIKHMCLFFVEGINADVNETVGSKFKYVTI